MKKSDMKPLIWVFIFSALLITSCEKYEDGPRISLKSKKERAANSWRIGAKYKNGTEETLSSSDVENKLILDKEGFVTLVTAGNYFSSSTPGTWTFSDDKKTLQIVIYEPTGPTTSSPTTTNYTILKLKEKELWLKETDSKGDVYEYHYVPI